MSSAERRSGSRRSLGRACSWLVVLALVLATSWSSRVHAATMRHHDLASLALMSEAIVLARRISTRVVDYDILVTHEILAVYEGPLTVGATLEVPCQGYLTGSLWSATANEWTADDEVVLFLHRSRRRKTDPSKWRLVSSGMRIFQDGVVHRFEQRDNPGPYVPVPQGRDPFDVMGDPRGDPAATWSQFEEDLRRAIERAAVVDVALAQIGTPEGTRRLLDGIGPPWWVDGDYPVPFGNVDRWEDRVATAAIEALAEREDLGATLDGITRVRGGWPMLWLRHPFEERSLIDVALDPAQPVPRRVAALQLLGQGGFSVRTAEAFAGAMALWSDPHPLVRQAAAEIRLRSEDVTPRIENAVIEAFRKEPSPRVRYALAKHADALGIRDRLGKPWRAVWAERRNRIVDIAWIDSGWPFLVELQVELRDGEAPPRLISVDPNELPRWALASTGRASVFIGPEHELQTGTEITAWVTLGDARGTKKHRLPLRAYGTQTEPAASIPASLEATGGPRAVEVEDAPETVPPIAPRRGGGCTVDAGSGGRRPGASLMLSLVVLAALGGRRASASSTG